MDNEREPFVRTHHECPGCASSDGAATRVDGSVYCFVCDSNFDGDQAFEAQPAGEGFTVEASAQTSDPKQAAVQPQRPSGQVKTLKHRGLNDATILKMYRYEVAADGAELAHYCDTRGQWLGTKVRGTDKRFWWEGTPVTSGLYGAHLVPQPTAYNDTVVITEGEIDAITVRTATKLHSVSLPGGAGSVAKVLADEKSWDYLTSFDKVIVALDGDEQGLKAAELLCSSLCMSHRDVDVRMVSWPDGSKDASDVHTRENSKVLSDTIERAPAWRPSGVFNAAELAHLLDVPDDDGVPFPFEALQSMLRGLRRELITVTAGTGVGKSTLVRTLALSLIKEHGLRVGMIMLEESNKRTLKALIGMSAEKPLLMDSQCMSVEAQKRELAAISGMDNLWLYDLFGSSDAEGLLARMSWLAAGCKCDFIVLDHITMATTLNMNQQHLNERQIIDAITTEIRAKIVERTGTGVIMVAHPRKPSSGDHTFGTASLNLSDIRGSGGPAAMSDAVIGLEKMFDENGEQMRDVVKINVMKNRYTGETSPHAGSIFFNRATGCLEERHEDFAKISSDF